MLSLMNEVMWKEIPGHIGYEASEDGRVRSLDAFLDMYWKGKPCKRFRKGRELRQTFNKANGYMYVHLGRDFISTVHALVALTFIGPSEEGQVVRHRNGDKSNNCSGNLVYGSSVENFEDAVHHGTAAVGERHYNAVLNEQLVLEIRERCDAGESVKSVARDIGIKYATALAAKNRRTWAWL
jgi:hypothetical protein